MSRKPNLRTLALIGFAALALAQIVIDEITVVGSRCGPFEKALAALERRDIDVTSLISQRFPLEQGVQALQKAGEAGVLKVLIDVSTESAATP